MSSTKAERLLFAHRIKDLLRQRGLTQSQVAKKLGLVPQTVQQWTTGKAMPRGNTLNELATVLEVDAKTFFEEPEQGGVSTALPFEIRDKRYVYIESFKSDDKPAGVKVLATERQFFDSVVGEGEAAEFKIVAVRDNSMSPTIKEGDSIIMNIKENKVDGDGLYCFSIDDTLYIKRLQRTPQGILVISDNSAYRDFLIPVEASPQPVIHGKIIAILGVTKIS